MRPAQRRLAAAVPQPAAGVEARQATVTGVAGNGNASVDFGDGVAVPCPRCSSCPPLAAGDAVLVLRQDHSNLIVDLITPLGGS